MANRSQDTPQPKSSFEFVAGTRVLNQPILSGGYFSRVTQPTV